MQKIAIVNGSFWPESAAIGEALLLLSESLAVQSKTIVITQVGKDFRERLASANRGKGIKISSLPKWTNSSSHLGLRISELALFTSFVFTSLCWHRPDQVYVSTNPPMITPLAVRWYCELFDKKYIYHLQDIHPEATQVVTGKANMVTRLLSRLDIKTMIQADQLVTLTDQMKSYILQRTGKNLPIVLLDNPSVQNSKLNNNSNKIGSAKRKKGFVYCGNAGRLQRIPLLLTAIERYLKLGGDLPFIFAGGGIYISAIEELAKKFEKVSYLGVVPTDEAAELLGSYTFGLMPIDDEVTNYAFPSKSSSYVFSGCHVIAICGKDTSVANWVHTNNVGFVVEPNVEAIIELFHDLEAKPVSELKASDELINRLTPVAHAKKLEEIVLKIS